MSNIVKRGFQPLFFKGIDEKWPADDEKVIVVTRSWDFFTGCYNFKEKTWYMFIGSHKEPVDRSGVACWASFNPADIFGGESNDRT